MFNALLDITKLDAAALASRITEFPIADLLGRIGSTFARMAQEKGLSFRAVPSSAWVRSDPVLLERIVLNLVSNAVRYTKSGGIVVGCRHRRSKLHVEVADSGPGIPEDQQRKIFNEFYRLVDSAKTNQAGLGLGLAIVERLCALLDHPIALASTPGKGSRFSVAVPAAQAAARPKADTPQLAAIDVARGKLVVVIDNDPRVLEGMSGLLRDWGCRVVTGFVDGRNVAIEYRWAEGDVERLPALASELVRHGGGMAPALAAKAATQSIPIVYYSGGDPVRTGLAASINRPGGNVTGISNFSEILEAKRLDLLRRLVPKARPRNHCDVGKAGFEALLCRQVIDRVEGCCCQFFMSTRPEHHARKVMLTPPYVLEPAPDSGIAAAARTALHAILGLGRRT